MAPLPLSTVNLSIRFCSAKLLCSYSNKGINKEALFASLIFHTLAS